MPFSIRPYRRFPVQCAVIYQADPFQGQGTVWYLSISDWHLSTHVPGRPGENSVADGCVSAWALIK
jgi:hypothetical protein